MPKYNNRLAKIKLRAWECLYEIVNSVKPGTGTA